MKKKNVDGCASISIPLVLVCFLVLFISNKAFGQNSVWATRSGGTNNDEGVAVKTDNSGNTYVAGNLASSSGTIFIAKYNSSGVPLWSGTIGGTGTESLGDMCIDDLGFIYITGIFASGTVDFDISDNGTKNLTNTAGTVADIFVAKYKTNGAIVWAYNISNSAGSGINIQANSIFVKTNKLYITGATTSATTVNFDPKASSASADITPNTGLDMYFASYDTAFNFSVVKNIGSSTTTEVGRAICADNSGNIYLTGYFSGTVDFNPSTMVTSNLIELGFLKIVKN